MLALGGLMVIAATTLVPLRRQAAAAATTPLWCIVCGDYGGVDVVTNVLLFIPFALGLRVSGFSTRFVVATGALISLTIESLQLAIIPGRDASLSDLLTNTLGSLIGAALGSRIATLVCPTSRQAIALAGLAAMLWLGIQSGTAGLLRPWVPADPLLGEWGRPLPGRAPFDGRVTSAFVSGTAVPDGSMPVDSQLPALLAQGRVRLELTLLSGRPYADWLPVFEILGPHGPVLGVEAVGKDLTFRPPARAYLLRLRGPALRLPKSLPAEPGLPVQLAAGERRDTLWASWMTAGTFRRAFQPLSPSFGWSLVMPLDYAYGPEVHLLTALWIAGLLLPVAYWTRAAGATRFRGLALATLLLTGLGLIPLLTGYPGVHWSEWVAGGVGLALGWASHRRAAAYLGKRCDSPSIKESC